MENKEKEGVEIDLKRIFLAVLYRWWIILLAMILCGSAAFCYAKFSMDPVYSSNVKLYVNNNYVDSPGYSSNQIMAAKDLANTFMVILESRSVLEEVADKTGGNYSYSKLKGMVSAASIDETEVFQVTVTGTSYKDVAIIANYIAEVFPAKCSEIVEGSSVRVVDYAVENRNQVGPSYQKYLILGAALGMVLSMALVVIVDLTDKSIKSEEYLIDVYGKFPLLAVIPDSQGSGSSHKKGYYRGYYRTYAKKPEQNPAQEEADQKPTEPEQTVDMQQTQKVTQMPSIKKSESQNQKGRGSV